jgi:cystathionine gamma-synthase
MLSFDLRGGKEAARAFVEGLGCITLAESLGGIESLIAYPVTMSHAVLSEEERLRAGIGPGLLRLSVGVEHIDDLVDDVTAGLERVARLSVTPVSDGAAS